MGQLTKGVGGLAREYLSDFEGGKGFKIQDPQSTGDKLKHYRDFPGSPVVNTWCFHCKGHRLDGWSGN